MDAVAEKKTGVHHGRNLRIARTCENVTQEDLAFRVDMSQSKISALELQEVIDDDTLDKVATALEVPVSFLKNFRPKDAIKSYSVTNNQTYEMTQTNSDSASGNCIVQQKVVEKQENIYYPLEKITELYDKLLQEKDKQIDKLEKQLSSFQKQVDELKAQLK
jgi:transcriptional regulator with XRE-family HTH domain